ncbi:hypothetical protein SARC_09656 [Sphaeroforma arctica JP610]|uniref:Uncharacterized protein n=1 Tax=Sphaeroforma arctica JP610 TaxID=667725 RepID=A0A0L0FM88_9EUKA|nr:hypothetical protein SARC_09656 [Sphaeroforma arctica JP610]KNC77899.1 hypothetical protein SARC_09656 [Sphaeroforma arctica JP610]|eukprot:XP_014151801.1 hypothetical protein SARC_09656 [Sphaeroforma arctica JP610]
MGLPTKSNVCTLTVAEPALIYRHMHITRKCILQVSESHDTLPFHLRFINTRALTGAIAESFVLLWKKTEDGEENILVENKKSELKEMKSSMRDKGSKFLIQKSISFPRLTMVDCIFKVKASTPVEVCSIAL